jgi:hypothetical protein
MGQDYENQRQIYLAFTSCNSHTGAGESRTLALPRIAPVTAIAHLAQIGLQMLAAYPVLLFNMIWKREFHHPCQGVTLLRVDAFGRFMEEDGAAAGPQKDESS